MFEVIDFTYAALLREFEQIVCTVHDLRAQIKRLREEASA
jgi:hypothetical protein